MAKAKLEAFGQAARLVTTHLYHNMPTQPVK